MQQPEECPDTYLSKSSGSTQQPSGIEGALAAPIRRAVRNAEATESSANRVADLARRHDPNVVMLHRQQIYGGDVSRTRYAEMYWSAVLNAGRNISAEGGMTSQELMAAFGAERRRIADVLSHADAQQFGQPSLNRTVPLDIYTPVMARYGEFPHVQSFVARLRTHGESPFGDKLRATDYNPGKLWTVHAKDFRGDAITLSCTADISPENIM